jgi:hypothetical protein
MLTRNPTTTGNIPVRSPQILVPIIADGLNRVRRDITEVGRGMAEARQQMSHAAFLEWSQKNFRLKRTQALYYLNIGLSEPDKSGETGHGTGRKRTRRNQKQHKKKNGAAAPTSADNQLGIDLIEAGFRTLAKTMHPDMGGSASAMTALNRVRGRLKTLWKRQGLF